MTRRWLLLLALLFMASPAWAHKPSDSYLHVELQKTDISGRWDIAVRDLEYAIGIDTNDDGEITWGELKIQQPAVESYAFSRLKITRGGSDCALSSQDFLLDRHSDGAYAVLVFTARCASSAEAVAIDYRLLFDVDPQHKGLASVTDGKQTSTLIFEASKPLQALDFKNASPWSEFGRFVYQGVWHIWLGFDHVLFLLALMMPSVLRRENNTWHAADDRRSVLIDVVKIVTAFTIAHSITLSLAALGIVDVPSRLVESLIAASVILAALNNIFPLFTRHRTKIAFGFGLLHGFGFASVLADLGLAETTLVRSLLGFNLGVELGQMLIVALLLPIAYRLRTTRFYQRGVLWTGSLLIAMLATAWLFQRAFDISQLF